MPAPELVNIEHGKSTEVINPDEKEEAMSPSVINTSADQEELLADVNDDETELVDMNTEIEIYSMRTKR